VYAKSGLIRKPGSSFLLFLTITLLGVIVCAGPGARIAQQQNTFEHRNQCATRHIYPIFVPGSDTNVCLSAIKYSCAFYLRPIALAMTDSVDRPATPPFKHIHIPNLPNESCRPQYGVGVCHIVQVPTFIFGIFLDVNIEYKARYILKYQPSGPSATC
jgi:hypothetical protein